MNKEGPIEILRIEQVSMNFGSLMALDGVDAALHQGEILGMICGQTYLLVLETAE